MNNTMEQLGVDSFLVESMSSNTGSTETEAAELTETVTEERGPEEVQNETSTSPEPEVENDTSPEPEVGNDTSPEPEVGNDTSPEPEVENGDGAYASGSEDLDVWDKMFLIKNEPVEIKGLESKWNRESLYQKFDPLIHQSPVQQTNKSQRITTVSRLFDAEPLVLPPPQGQGDPDPDPTDKPFMDLEIEFPPMLYLDGEEGPQYQNTYTKDEIQAMFEAEIAEARQEQTRLRDIRGEDFTESEIPYPRGSLDILRNKVEEVHQNGLDEVHQNGVDEIHQNGIEEIHQNGVEEIHQNGVNEVHQNGVNEVDQNGVEEEEADELSMLTPPPSTRDDALDTLAEQELYFETKLSEKDERILELQRELALAKQKQDSPPVVLEEKPVINEEQMRPILAEYEITMSSYTNKIEELEKKLKKSNEERAIVIKERDSAVQDLANVELAFSDVHRKYERAKGVLENCKKNEEQLKERDAQMIQKINCRDEKILELKERVKCSLEEMYKSYENKREALEKELVLLRAKLRKADMTVETLQHDVEQKTKEVKKLHALCDEIIAEKSK